MKRFKCGLAVMRAQPLHQGHQMIIQQMLDECVTTVVVLGSAQEWDTPKNPFTVAQRVAMIRNVFGADMAAGRLRVMGLQDLGDMNRWADYVLTAVALGQDLTPDAYYCGGESDGPRFAAAGLTLRNISRETLPISGTYVRDNLRRGDGTAVQYIAAQNRDMVMRKLCGKSL